MSSDYNSAVQPGCYFVHGPNANTSLKMQNALCQIQILILLHSLTSLFQNFIRLKFNHLLNRHSVESLQKFHGLVLS